MNQQNKILNHMEKTNVKKGSRQKNNQEKK